MDCLKLPKWTVQQFLNCEYRLKVNGLKIFKVEIRRSESFKLGRSNNFEVSHQTIEQQNYRYNGPDITDPI